MIFAFLFLSFTLYNIAFYIIKSKMRITTEYTSTYTILCLKEEPQNYPLLHMFLCSISTFL